MRVSPRDQLKLRGEAPRQARTATPPDPRWTANLRPLRFAVWVPLRREPLAKQGPKPERPRRHRRSEPKLEPKWLEPGLRCPYLPHPLTPTDHVVRHSRPRIIPPPLYLSARSLSFIFCTISSLDLIFIYLILLILFLIESSPFNFVFFQFIINVRRIL